MFEFCINIGGHKHCFPVPSLIDITKIRIPKPTNYPPFELAIAVLQLVEALPASELSKELSAVATRFVQNVQKDLPQGVELTQDRTARKAA
jgi:hypothetical protein